MRARTFLLILIFNQILVSCKNESAYAYCEDFTAYLTQELQVDNLEGENIYFLLPINGCDNCIMLNIGLLSSTKYNVQLILVGETFDTERVLQIQNLYDLYDNILVDDKFVISQYETGFSKPMIVDMKDGKCIYHLNISDFKIEEAKMYLDKRAL